MTTTKLTDTEMVQLLRDVVFDAQEESRAGRPQGSHLRAKQLLTQLLGRTPSDSEVRFGGAF